MRRLLIFVVVFGVTLLAGWVITYHLLPQTYTATAQIQILWNEIIDVAGLDPPSDWETETAEALQTMRAPDVLLPVIHDLGFDQAWAKRIDPLKGDRLPDSEAVEHLNKILKLDVLRGTNIVSITVTDDVSIEAARIANAIADRYKITRDTESAAWIKRGKDALTNQIGIEQKAVEDLKAALEKLPEEFGPKMSPEARQILGQLEAQQAGLKDAEKTGDAANPRVEQLQMVVDDLRAKLAEAIAGDNPLQKALRELDQDQSLLDALKQRLKQDIDNPKLIQGPVRIVSRAEVPTAANHPAAPVVTFTVATLLGLVASFGEKRFRSLGAV